MCYRQCQWRPHLVPPNFHAERSSPQTAGDLNISNYTILNPCKLHARRIWLFAARPDGFNPLSIMNSRPTKIQSKTWTWFPSSNTLNTSTTWSINHSHLFCGGQKHTLALVLRGAIMLLSHANPMLRVVLRQTYKTISSTCLQLVKSSNIPNVGSISRAWRHTMTMCWRKKTPLCVSQALKTGTSSRTSWLAYQIIRLSGSGNYTLSRIWHRMTITNALSNTVVKTSSKASDSWCCSQPTPSVLFTRLSISLTAILHRNASMSKCTLHTGGGRHR